MKSLCMVFLVAMCFCASISAQTTAFTFQGSLQSSGSPANGNYDFEFKLFDLVSAGAQQGSTLQRLNVAVANGIFTVSLDFGAGTLSGTDRFLDIAVRTSGLGVFTVLSPRQKVNSAPYSVRSLNSATATNATQLGGVAANQYVVTTDPRMTDARDPLPGSNSYIRNSGAQQQAGASFWISGSGNFGGAGNFDSGLSVGGNFIVGGNTTLTGNLTVNGTLTGNLPSGDADYIQNRTTQQTGTNFNIGGNGTVSGTLTAGTVQASNVNGNIITGTIVNSGVYRIGDQNVLTNFGTQNIAVGINSGAAGADNSFFGFNAGNGIQAGGTDNSFFGSDAGGINTTGSENSFFGSDTGDSNTTGFNNSFFGRNAGAGNSTGNSNAFFGHSAGLGNTTASNNSFFGTNAGFGTTTGGNNSFFGRSAGSSNTTGFSNSFFGYQAGFNTAGGGNNAFFGATAGDANTSGQQNTFIGSNAGGATTTGDTNTFIGRSAGSANTTGSNNTIIGANANVPNGDLSYVTVIGAGVTASAQSNSIYIGRDTDSVYVRGGVSIDGGLLVGYGTGLGNLFVNDYAAFNNDVRIEGDLVVAGTITEERPDGTRRVLRDRGSERGIADAADSINVYSGKIVTDADGLAVVTLPNEASVIGRDFRYQLTVMGVFAQAIIAEEIEANKFKIRTDKPNVKVSWQVTGVKKKN
ncbi:MAG: hypothetical protein IPL32_09580 [Chloracidobacterium sp.]|nr:hypothetical protein [Chloracidobacterium sp.]